MRSKIILASGTAAVLLFLSAPAARADWHFHGMLPRAAHVGPVAHWAHRVPTVHYQRPFCAPYRGGVHVNHFRAGYHAQHAGYLHGAHRGRH
jgi:hypothetical protein